MPGIFFLVKFGSTPNEILIEADVSDGKWNGYYYLPYSGSLRGEGHYKYVNDSRRRYQEMWFCQPGEIYLWATTRDFSETVNFTYKIRCVYMDSPGK